MAVFVSHSKYDVELRKFFAEISSAAGLEAKYMEFENMGEKYPAREIANIIKPLFGGVSAVFVLLGKNVESPPTGTPQFTHNWINFEVGVAAGSNRPVWVFEDFNDFIKFPIPYVTDYCRFNLNTDRHIMFYKDLLKDRFVHYTNRFKPNYSLTCNLCRAEFNVWNPETTLNCPV